MREKGRFLAKAQAQAARLTLRVTLSPNECERQNAWPIGAVYQSLPEIGVLIGFASIFFDVPFCPSAPWAPHTFPLTAEYTAWYRLQSRW